MKINNADLIISKIWRILKKRNKKKPGKQHKKLHLCLLILKGLSGSAKAATQKYFEKNPFIYFLQNPRCFTKTKTIFHDDNA